MHTLTIFYDSRCGLCSRVRQWLLAQPSHVRFEFLPYDSPAAARRMPGLRHLRAENEIVVLADTGEVWQGSGAWIMCLWALREYRGWSVRLAAPALQTAARSIVEWISRHRVGLSRLLLMKSDADLLCAAAREAEASVCTARHDLDLID